MSEIRVTMADVRDAKICAKGARDTAQHYNLDWVEFVHNGMTAEAAEATGNAVLIELAARARAKAAKE